VPQATTLPRAPRLESGKQNYYMSMLIFQLAVVMRENKNIPGESRSIFTWQ
jgi:hypothetical protein